MNNMKKLQIKILAGAVLLSSLMVACNNKAEFTSASFVRLNSESYSCTEDVGTVKIPVYAYTSNGTLAFPRSDEASTNVSFTVTDGTAKQGTNFTVSPSNGVLEFSGESVAYIEIDITNLEGEYTGDLSFSIDITSANNGYTLGGVTSADVTIKDNDHPLSPILGTWVAYNVEDYWGDVYDLSLQIDPVTGSTTSVTISGLCPYTKSRGYELTPLSGEVSSDMSTITVASHQYYYGTALWFVVYDWTFSETDAQVFNYDSESGTLTVDYPWGARASGGYYDLIVPDNLTFTKQQ